jgi:hypothetical protein
MFYYQPQVKAAGEVVKHAETHKRIIRLLQNGKLNVKVLGYPTGAKNVAEK